MVMGVLGTVNVASGKLNRALRKTVAVPKGIFMMIDSGSCPIGWTEDTDFVDRYPKGASSSLGTTGGTENYDHSHGSTVNLRQNPAGARPMANDGSTSGASNSTWYPPYVKVKFCVKN